LVLTRLEGKEYKYCIFPSWYNDGLASLVSYPQELDTGVLYWILNDLRLQESPLLSFLLGVIML